MLARGEDVAETDVDWLNRYRSTAEYRGQMRFVQAFQHTTTRSEHGQG